MTDTHIHMKPKVNMRLAGFGNIFRSESRKWLGTRRWLIQSLIWLFMVNSLVMVADFWSAESREAIVNRGMEFFFLIILILPILGLSIMMQGIIVAEKQSGTAAWVLSKPVSRKAFILAKFFGNLIPALLIMIVLQSGVAYFQIATAAGGMFPAIQFFGKTGVAMLHLLFYHALILMLGTLFQVRGPVAGIPIVLLLGLLISDEILPSALIDISPAGLFTITSGSLASINPVTLVVVPSWIIVFVLVSLWRFEKEEF
ncbi:MAG: hypothetical protein DWQ07_11345 [Chloroflexi bacterium]|nr:MAG: hypothetical protein DWQ07_11345 [Chloroflexota bacterium]MBL1197294.1 hypothetical protein [Chloroflexota bacterium]NOH14590.1 ABC transporter permease subunit [Chloroflexota bacterium]